jgi:hypothetical protein
MEANVMVKRYDRTPWGETNEECFRRVALELLRSDGVPDDELEVAFARLLACRDNVIIPVRRRRGRRS